MKDNNIFAINEVCRILDTTSRTLRFYEEKGIIKSTIVPFSNKRHYTVEQLAVIRKVIALRTLGLSVKAIKDLQNQDGDLKDALLSRRAEMIAAIETKSREIRILNEALVMLDDGIDILKEPLSTAIGFDNTLLKETAQKCAEAIVFENSELLYAHLSEKLKEYMPLSVYDTVRTDTLLPLGEFVSFDRQEYNAEFPNIIYQYIKYEKLGLKIKFVFHGGKIDGLWLNYCEL